ncbi:MAG: AAA family ATPase [Spirochaetales bacterium]|nr:AAA family ATPase [Spirochaetales bacterium]
MVILPIASGKGGVGKSLLASNLAIALGQAGKKVVLADLDLGASNIHLILGIGNVKKGIGTFLNNSQVAFEEIILDTEYDNVRFIPGDAEIPGMANVTTAQKNKLIRRILDIQADFVILDLGAGTSYNIIDFFLTSGQGIIITSPTLTATLNAYLFLKNAVFRIIYTSFDKKSPGRAYLENLRKDGSSLQKVYIPKLLEKLNETDPSGFEIFHDRIEHFEPLLVMNLLEDPKDGDKAQKIRRSCKEYLGVDMEHLGVIYRDHLQDIALGSRIPVLVYKPQSVISQAIYRIADKLIQKESLHESLLDIRTFEESFQTAELEAEIDYGIREHDVERLLHSGALTRGDLIETVKTQQYEIQSLRKENQMLKVKLLKAANEGFQV